ncbi:hypothetical protein BGX29_008818 [Mortierella sp. GBA35]|nr:hypothetical protein BGX29_008818 [Mortierella sp. GBA35]
MAASVSAQTCGGTLINNGTEGTFTVQYYGTDITVLTMYGLNNNVQSSESYLLYCTDLAPESQALTILGVPSIAKKFKVPVQKTLVGGNYTSSYVELAGGRSTIAVLERPQNIVSPCLQARVANNSIVALDDGIFDQYNAIDVGFRVNPHQSQLKDVWVPESVEVKPLLRAEYIKALSLFFNNGNRGEEIYSTIKGAYENLKNDMAGIAPGFKKRIGWVKYDFARVTWVLRNSDFVQGIIKDAGGRPFPLNGDPVPDNYAISIDDFKTLVTNADVIIDQTEFNGDKGGTLSTFAYWKKLAGFTGNENIRVIDKKFIYSLDNTVNLEGVSDYLYRMPSRPDLLLRDLIYVQYPTYDPKYELRFLSSRFQYGQGANVTLTPDNCVDSPNPALHFSYNSGDITVTPSKYFPGDIYPPPPLVGGGIYGAGGTPQGGESSGGGSKTSSIIIAVVCVAAVLGAAFAFAFYKWSHRAKEDRFIELEEEMNNEIPLH